MRRVKYILFLIIISNSFFLNAQSTGEIENAKRFYEKEQWQNAIMAYSTIVEKNKYNGQYYYNLAQCFFNLKNYDEAIKNFKVSLSIGYNYGNCIKKVALCYVQKGDVKNSWTWINKGLQTPKSLTIGNIVSDTIFKEFRKTNSFKSIYPRDSTLSRHEKWKTDIQFLKQRFEAKHYDIYNNISRSEWNMLFDDLLNSISSKSNEEILINLMKITAKIGDGHTFIRPPLSGDLGMHFYPFKLFMFDEGLFVMQTTTTYKKALGLRLTHINDMQIEKVLKKIGEVISVDNEIGLLERFDFIPMISELLHGLNISNNSNNTLFTFQNENGKELKIDVTAEVFNPMVLTEKLEQEITEKPLYMKKENEFFWSQQLKDFDAMYIKVNINLSTPQNNIREFYVRVFDSISRQKIKRLIIDLRHCPGGNSFNNETLIKLIMANETLDKENGLFTIIGRKTFSAAMNLASDLEKWTNTKFIGEPTGSKPNFIGETNFVTLPNTGLHVSISDAFWQKSVSWDKRNWIAPDIYIQNSFRNYKNGVDPVLNTIESIISNKIQK